MIGLIVEGMKDKERIENAITDEELQFVVLQGNGVSKHKLKLIEELISSSDIVYIATDPDEAGDIAAKKIKDKYPTMNRLMFDKEKCSCMMRFDRIKYGVEFASGKYIRSIFLKQYKGELK